MEKKFIKSNLLLNSSFSTIHFGSFFIDEFISYRKKDGHFE